MKNSQYEQIKANLEKKTTKELRQIFNAGNWDEWTQEAFIAIESILKDRNEFGNDGLTCSECGATSFEYDEYYKEHTCNQCGNIERVELNLKAIPLESEKNIFESSYNYIVWMGKIIGVVFLGIPYAVKTLTISDKVTPGILGAVVFGLLGIYFGMHIFSVMLWQTYICIKKVSVNQCAFCLQQSTKKNREKLFQKEALKKLSLMSEKSPDALSELVNVISYKNLDNDFKRQALISIRKKQQKTMKYAYDILHLLKSDDTKFKKEAIKTLVAITGQNFGDDADQWKQWLKNS
jgi:hypothetical protein